MNVEQFLKKYTIKLIEKISLPKIGTIYHCTIENRPSYLKLYDDIKDQRIDEEVKLFQTNKFSQLPRFINVIKETDLIAVIFESYRDYVPLYICNAYLTLDPTEALNVINGLLKLNSELISTYNRFIYKFNRKSIMYHKVTGEIRVFGIIHQETYDDSKKYEFIRPICKFIPKIIPWVNDYVQGDIYETDPTLTVGQKQILQRYKELLSNSNLKYDSSPKSVYDIGEAYLFENDVCI